MRTKTGDRDRLCRSATGVRSIARGDVVDFARCFARCFCSTEQHRCVALVLCSGFVLCFVLWFCALFCSLFFVLVVLWFCALVLCSGFVLCFVLCFVRCFVLCFVLWFCALVLCSVFRSGRALVVCSVLCSGRARTSLERHSTTIADRSRYRARCALAFPLFLRRSRSLVAHDRRRRPPPSSSSSSSSHATNDTHFRSCLWVCPSHDSLLDESSHATNDTHFRSWITPSIDGRTPSIVVVGRARDGFRARPTTGVSRGITRASSSEDDERMRVMRTREGNEGIGVGARARASRARSDKTRVNARGRRTGGDVVERTFHSRLFQRAVEARVV